MKIILTLLLVCFMALPALSDASEKNNACPRNMTSSVEQKLLPVLKALENAQKKNDYFDKEYERQFDRLLKAKDKASREARVALMDYYVGEHFGEELTCAVALDCNQIKPIVELYQKCDIRPSLSPVARDRSLPLRGYVLEMLSKGHVKEQCTFD